MEGVSDSAVGVGSSVGWSYDGELVDRRCYAQAGRCRVGPKGGPLTDEAYIETQTGNHIKTVRSDRGGEFLSKEFIQHQDSRGTIRKITVHDSPQQNGVAERGM